MAGLTETPKWLGYSQMWKVENLKLPLAEQLIMGEFLSGPIKIFKFQKFIKPTLVAEGEAIRKLRGDNIFFRVIGRDNLLDLELHTFALTNYLGEKVWIPFSFYVDKHLLHHLLEINYEEFQKFRETIYSNILYALISKTENIKYPFVVDLDSPITRRTICVAKNTFVWEDSVENHLGEKHFVPRKEPNGYEISSLVSLIVNRHRHLG